MSEAQAKLVPASAILKEILSENPDGILEKIAHEHGTSTRDVVRALPDDMRTMVSGDQFAGIMSEIGKWGSVLFIVHTDDIVLECEGHVPPGSFGRGYYNMHGDSPIGGHIKAENCTEIAFVARPFMKRHSCSVQFFNGLGEAMFKIFVRRDAQRELIAEQREAFEQLMARYAADEPNA